MPQHVRVNVFPGLQTVPGLVAEQQGFFLARDMQIETVFTRSSQEQREALTEGHCDVAHSAIDNALAMTDAGIDVAVVMGLDSGFNTLMARSDISDIAQMRGRVFGVDAPDTAFALLGYAMLRRAGLERDRDYAVRVVGGTGQRLQALKAGEIDASLLMLPFNLLAQEAGLRVLGDPLDVVGPYQAAGAFVRRDWAACNAALLERYLTSYVEGLRWALDPANRNGVLALLRERLGLSADVAERSYQASCGEGGGFRTDAILDMRGVRTVAALRDTFSPRADGVPRDPGRTVDTSFHQRALALLGASPA